MRPATFHKGITATAVQSPLRPILCSAGMLAHV